MEITTSQIQGRVLVIVLRVRGTVDSSTFQDFTNAMRSAVESGAKFEIFTEIDKAIASF